MRECICTLLLDTVHVSVCVLMRCLCKGIVYSCAICSTCIVCVCVCVVVLKRVGFYYNEKRVMVKDLFPVFTLCMYDLLVMFSLVIS